MNNIFQKILIMVMSIYSCLNAFEVNTHQALTQCAITSSCGNGYAKNLYDFVNHGEIRNQSYGDEQFENYSKTYRQYANDGIGFGDWNISVKSNYEGMIEAGSVLEDAVYPVHDHDGDGRFNNHFYAAQFNAKYSCHESKVLNTLGLGDPYDMLSSRALCGGYGKRTDNIDWVFNSGVNVRWKGRNRKNDYGLHDALEYFRKSFEGSSANRRKYQAKLFVSLGHMVHMLQDLHSPAHCRDNAHAGGDYLEIFGRHSGGFRLNNGYFDSSNDVLIKNAIAARGRASSLYASNHFYSYEDFFKKEANWISKNFFSEAHGLLKKLVVGSTNFALEQSFLRSTSIYDGHNIYPSKSTVAEQAIPNAMGKNRWFYIKSLGNNASGVNGNIASGHNVIGLMEKGYFGNWPTMMELTKKGGSYTRYSDYNKRALQDTAINVMPRAVASTQAFINFFFRGQIETSISTKGILTLKNVSDTVLLSNPSLATFKQFGSKIKIYYTQGGNNILLKETTVSSSLYVGSSTSIDIKSEVLAKNLPQGTKITIVFDGIIGEDLGGYNSYGVGMKGLSVDVTTLPQIQTPRDVYTFSVQGRGETFPNRSHYSQSFGFYVNVYKNANYIGYIALNNLLDISWYDGSVHFHNSTMHHFDIWCTGSASLCNYLRTRVPTDTTVGYENWEIDWTIWNYGLWQNNATYFISNIKTQIRNYYTLQYASTQRSNAKLLNDLNVKEWKDSKIKRVPSLYIGSEEFIGIEHKISLVSKNTIAHDENLSKESDETDMFKGLTKEEAEEMKRIEEEENINE